MRKHFGLKFAKPCTAFICGALDYYCAEMVELSHGVAKDTGAKSIDKRHLRCAIQNDDELKQMFKTVQWVGSGMVPHTGHLGKAPAKTGKMSQK